MGLESIMDEQAILKRISETESDESFRKRILAEIEKNSIQRYIKDYILIQPGVLDCYVLKKDEPCLYIFVLHEKDCPVNININYMKRVIIPVTLDFKILLVNSLDMFIDKYKGIYKIEGEET